MGPRGTRGERADDAPIRGAPPNPRRSSRLERRIMRRTILSAAAPACLLIGFTPVAASADAAPPGNATAAAAQVSNLVGISKTGASADRTKAGAQAAVVSIGGQPALGTGGSQTTE